MLLGVAAASTPDVALAAESGCATRGAVSDAANNPGLVSDCEALLAAPDTLAGAATLNWSANIPIGEWDGVEDIRGAPPRVTRLYLRGNQLSGEIPLELGNLANLRFLDLTENQQTGEIPAELGKLTNLNDLWLWENQLSGEIPSKLGNLTHLTWLCLINNQLTGSISPELGNFTNLERLHLGANQLSGCLPSDWRTSLIWTVQTLAVCCSANSDGEIA